MRPLLVSFAFLCCLSALSEAADPAAIRKGAEATAKAMQQNDYNALLDHSYAKLIELGGGREAMLRQLEEAMGGMKKAGLTISSIKVGKPGEPVRGEDQLFSVVPIVLKVDGPKATVTTDGFLLAVSDDKGVTWGYIDGSSVTTDFLRRTFPKFPASLKLPANKEPVVKMK